jgi:hypothetical protein
VALGARACAKRRARRPRRADEMQRSLSDNGCPRRTDKQRRPRRTDEIPKSELLERRPR